jgi:tape measure domain-containing protein
MSDDLADLSVVFSANIDQLTSAAGAIDSIFASVASSAASSGSDITESMTTAAESFSSISEAVAEMSTMTAEGAAEAASSLDMLPAAGEEAGAGLSDSIEQASSGFSSLQDAISSLADSVNNAVSEINSQIDSIGTNAEEAADQAQSAGNGFSLGGMVNQVGMTIFSLQAMGNMATQTAGSLLGPAEQAENTEQSFGNLLGSTTAATDELGKLNDFAAKTQFKTQDIDNAAASLIAFKQPAQDIVPDLTAVGDALTAVGKGTPAEMQSVVDVIGKIGVQGKLTQGDITQLGAHGINAMDAIEKGSGLSSKALQDMISKGTLPAKDAIDDLTKGIEANPVYSGGMAKQAGTLSGQMSTLSSDFDQVMASALKPALPALETDLSKIETIITSPSFKTFAVTLGKDIATGITDVVTGVKDLVDTGKNLDDFFSKNHDALDALKAGLIGAGVAISAAVIPPLLEMGVDLLLVGVDALIAAAPFVLLGLVVGGVIFGIVEAVQHWGDIMHVAHDIIGNVTGGINTFFGNVGGKIHDITGGINNDWNGVGKAISGVWLDITGDVKSGINTIIDGINTFIGGIDAIQIHIPSIGVGPFQTPSFNWNGVGLGKIPRLATGGTVAPGSFAIAGDPGPNSELVYGGTSGLSVFSHDQSVAMAGGGGGETHIHNHIYLDSREITDSVMTRAVKIVRQQGGKMVTI